MHVKKGCDKCTAWLCWWGLLLSLLERDVELTVSKYQGRPLR